MTQIILNTTHASQSLSDKSLSFILIWFRLAILFIILLATPLLTGCSDNPSAQAVPAGSTVIALGDSLTYGYGATPEAAYPAVLAELTDWQVVNAGVNGDTSAEVLARIDGIIDQNPDLVLLGVGGNDVLQRIDSATTAANITASIGKLQQADIAVVLIAEPYFSTSAIFGKASDNPIYKDIADGTGVLIFTGKEGGWSDILSDESLKSDKIHANGAGYKEFSENLVEFLQEAGVVD